MSKLNEIIPLNTAAEMGQVLPGGLPQAFVEILVNAFDSSDLEDLASVEIIFEPPSLPTTIVIKNKLPQSEKMKDFRDI